MTTKLEQAARQALKALIDSDDGGGLRYTEVQAVAALREALTEQAEQEPIENNDWKKASYIRETLNAEQAEQRSDSERMEPVAIMSPNKANIVGINTPYANIGTDDWIKLYTAPVRTKDLTDDEILEAVGITDPQGCIKHSEFIGDARAVIAKDREKNK